MVRKKRKSPERVLIYYFGFPHYRRVILELLADAEGLSVDLVSGSSTRAGIAVVQPGEIAALEHVSTWRIGPISWDRGIVSRAVSSTYSCVVVGPAVASISTWTIVSLRAILGRRTLLWGVSGKPGERSIKRVLQEVMSRLSSGLLVYGRLEEAGATELGLDPRKVERVHNATAAQTDVVGHREAWERVQSSLVAAEKGQLSLVFAGRLNPDKNVSAVLEAARLLRRDFPLVRAVIIGDGPDRSRLRAAYAEDCFVFTGAIYDSALLERYLAEATIVVSPSTLGLLALDAVRVGTPTVIPDNLMNGSEVDALTLGVNASKFHHDSAEDMAKAVRSLISSMRQVTFDEYSNARDRGIREWSPAFVAGRIAAAMRGADVSTTPGD